MGNFKVLYQGELRNEATHLASGSTITTDAPLDNNGKGEAFSPTDLLCTSLATCMSTIMGITARKNQLDIDGMELDIVKVMAANPRRVAEVVIKFKMPDRPFSESDRELLENAARTCPVAMSLHPDLKQLVSFEWAS